MKTIALYSMILISFVQCRKESENCHFFITIKNNSNHEIIFSTGSIIPFPDIENSNCFINKADIKNINSNQEIKYRPYRYPDCIENRVRLDGWLIWPIHIIDSNNFTIGTVPCEEFEERNTILRTYILTLEDLERMNYTINYPEDASIGVD